MEAMTSLPLFAAVAVAELADAAGRLESIARELRKHKEAPEAVELVELLDDLAAELRDGAADGRELLAGLGIEEGAELGILPGVAEQAAGVELLAEHLRQLLAELQDDGIQPETLAAASVALFSAPPSAVERLLRLVILEAEQADGVKADTARDAVRLIAVLDGRHGFAARFAATAAGIDQ